MPEVRAGNATIHANGGETLADVQEAAALHGQWLAVDAHGSMTVAELLERRDGGPREARYGPLRGRVVSVGARGLRFGSEAIKDVAGYDVRRAWLGEVPIAHATLRLSARPAWSRDALLHGGDAFALADALRALPSAPAAIVVLAADLLAISDDAPASEVERRETDLERAAEAAGATVEPIDRPGWVTRCEALPSTRLRLSGKGARELLPTLDARWAYDAGRRLALVERDSITTRGLGDGPPQALVERVRTALAP
jgi:FAD/FMN-containing dehydrogenase